MVKLTWNWWQKKLKVIIMIEIDGVEIPDSLMEKFETYCEKKNISGDEKDRLLKKYVEFIRKSRYEPGEAVGVIAAQSISEPATQMTMRSYTMASTVGRLSKVTLGLPRLIEIFDARKTFERKMILHPKKEYNTREGALQIAKEIVEKKVSDIIEKSAIDLLEMRLEIHIKSEYNPEEIKTLLSKKFKKVEIENKGHIFYLTPEKNDVKDLRELKLKILDINVGGIKGIEEAGIFQDENGNWTIETYGSNLKKILEYDKIDHTNVYTNDIYEVEKTLGIEAARNVIAMEAKNTLDKQGLDVDVRHILMAADTMTADGKIKSVGRYGVSGSKGSVLARANFEETIKHLTRAAFRGEVDPLESIVENVMIGNVSPVGTGVVELGVDMEKIKKKSK